MKIDAVFMMLGLVSAISFALGAVAASSMRQNTVRINYQKPDGSYVVFDVVDGKVTTTDSSPTGEAAK